MANPIRILVRCDGVKFVVRQAEVRGDGSVVYHCAGHLVTYSFKGDRLQKWSFGPSHKIEEDLVDSVSEVSKVSVALAKELADQNLRGLEKEGRLRRVSGRRCQQFTVAGNGWADSNLSI